MFTTFKSQNNGIAFQIGPVIRHLHTPSIFCPGKNKFWSSSEKQCEIKFGYKMFN